MTAICPASYDVDVEIMELPHILRANTASLGARVPYLHPPSLAGEQLDGEPGKAERRKRRRIGFVWQAGGWDPRRSIPTPMLAELLERRRGRSLEIVEMPFYRLGPSGQLLQSFAPDDNSASLAIPLGTNERRLKRRMIAAHVTQRDVLSAFSLGAGPQWRSALARAPSPERRSGCLCAERR